MNLFSFAFSFWILWSSNATQSCFLRNREVSLIMYIVYLFVLLPLYAFMAALLGNTGNFTLNTDLICLTRNAEATYWFQTKHLKVFLLWKKKFYLIPFTWSSLGLDILMAIMKRTTNYSKQTDLKQNWIKKIQGARVCRKVALFITAGLETLTTGFITILYNITVTDCIDYGSLHHLIIWFIIPQNEEQ